MHEVDIRQVDLNLLVMLDALLEERSVTRAAERLGMSQPAMSRALARVRKVFSDALLVEAKGGYLLTARAEGLRPSLRTVLMGINELLETRPFEPGKATGSLRLLMTDLETASLVPGLLSGITAQAPGLNLDVLPPGPSIFEALETDNVEAVIGVVEDAPAGIQRRGLYDDHFVTLMRQGHPDARTGISLDRFQELGHIAISVTGSGPSPVDVALAELGRKRCVRVRVPSFLAALEIVFASDLVMTLPSSLVRSSSMMNRFVAVPPPVKLPDFTMSLLWHARHQDAPRHVWLRQMMVDAAHAMTTRGKGERPDLLS